jgi:hypothetical protein
MPASGNGRVACEPGRKLPTVRSTPGAQESERKVNIGAHVACAQLHRLAWAELLNIEPVTVAHECAPNLRITH